MRKKSIYNFDFGTLTEETETIKISISKEQFSNHQKSEIDSLITSQDDRFLTIEKITEDDQDYHFYFKKDTNLKNGLNLKNEEYPVKVSIAREILKQDILHEYETDNLFISINPSTLYYHPMRTIKYTYAGNQYMPKANYTTLQMYKACVASILSNIPYEKCLATPQDVENEANEFIKEIYAKNSVAELLTFLTDSQDYIEYDYIQNRSKEKSKWKTLLISTASILTIAAIGSALAINSINDNNREALANEYESTIASKDLIIQANEQMDNGEYEKAVESYTKAEADLSEVAEELVEKGQYQLAIDTDENQLENVITKLYQEDEKTAIKDLNGEQLSDKAKAKLADEQAIADNNKNEMLNILNFLDDENTAERLTEAFIQDNDLTNAQKVQEKYPDNQVIAELLEKGDLQSQVEQLEERVKDENNDDEKEKIQKQLDEAKQKLQDFD